MTLKEELEILRGEPIQEVTGDPMDIPCIETSDPEKLCKHPVVSVHMVTYNHEPYIRQAIEGVMMQKTDFEFELVIGEDCSTDKTREICFEYQKRFPDKIRVLWCDHNLYRNPHPAGGNWERNLAHCRGEFIAICEGDDYWIDPLKLQKQVDIMRKYPNVGVCFTNGQSLIQESHELNKWWSTRSFDAGEILGGELFTRYAYGNDPRKGCGPECFILTASLLIRASVYCQAQDRFEILNWRLRLGDKTLILGCSLISDGYYLDEESIVYRRHNTGAMATYGNLIYVDSAIVKLWYSISLNLTSGFNAPSYGPIIVLIYNRLSNSTSSCLNKSDVNVFYAVFKRAGMKLSRNGFKMGIRLWLFFTLKRTWPLTFSLRSMVK